MKKLMPFILLLIFFAGQINLAWAKHYCDGRLVAAELTLSPKAHNCCGGDSQSSNDCCEDQIAQADSDDFFKKSEISVSISPEFTLLGFVFFQGFPPIKSISDTFLNYSPDIPSPEILVLHQTFLI